MLLVRKWEANEEVAGSFSGVADGEQLLHIRIPITYV